MTTADLGHLPNWDLSHLYPSIDSPELQADLAKVEADCKAFTRHKGTLSTLVHAGDGDQALLAIIREYEALNDLGGKLGSYSSLRACTDLLDDAIAKASADIDQRITDAFNNVVFFSLELNALVDEVVDELCDRNPALGFYKPFLTDLRREKPYELTEEIERLFSEKGMTGKAAWGRLFEETLSAFKVTIRGEELALEAALKNMMDKDPDLRRESAMALAAVFKGNVRLFTLIMNTLAKDKEISDRWRGFEDIADSRHLSNRVEREVVEALVSSVREAYPRLSHRYYALKAKWLGMDALNFWDRNAPLPKDDDRDIPFDEAKRIVLDSYRAFSPKVADIAQRFFDENWIDAPVKVGKTSGAFSASTVPSAHPYILLNYLGKQRDVMTMAHELGHGVHQVLAGKQGALMAGTPLTLAETASVFGEMLTFRALLAATTDKAQRKALLASKVEDMLNTVVRQIAFYTFEREVHTQRKIGELTADDISAIWLKVQRESLGPAVLQNEGYEHFWTYIGHFIFTPFYVYAYAWGDCLVNALYAKYEAQPEGFEEKYIALLEAGGSKPYRELLEPFGLDPSDPSFWQAGLRLIESMIDELEQMD